MTVSIPAALRNRARATYWATSYAEGDNTWSHFVAKAIEAETARREAEHNEGAMYPSWGENLPGGRRLKDMDGTAGVPPRKFAPYLAPQPPMRGTRLHGYRCGCCTRSLSRSVMQNWRRCTIFDQIARQGNAASQFPVEAREALNQYARRQCE